jgi:hypothetical protein
MCLQEQRKAFNLRFSPLLAMLLSTLKSLTDYALTKAELQELVVLHEILARLSISDMTQK